MTTIITFQKYHKTTLKVGEITWHKMSSLSILIYIFHHFTGTTILEFQCYYNSVVSRVLCLVSPMHIEVVVLAYCKRQWMDTLILNSI